MTLRNPRQTTKAQRDEGLTKEFKSGEFFVVIFVPWCLRGWIEGGGE
jgi:hypothetical protein